MKSIVLKSRKDKMNKKCSIESYENLKVFAKTQPKVTKINSGYVYEFSDVFSLVSQKSISAENVNMDELIKIGAKRGIKIMKSKREKQLKFPF
jgi:hypothetical protein